MRPVALLGQAILGGVGVAALISAGFLPWFFLMGPGSEQHGRSEWPTVQGTVLSSEISIDVAEITVFWGLAVSFFYEVEGVGYTGEQDWRATGGEPEAEREKRNYAPGKAVTVYHNPVNPSSAVVEQKGLEHWVYMVVAFGSLFGLAGVAVLCMGVGTVILGGVRRLRRLWDRND